MPIKKKTSKKPRISKKIKIPAKLTKYLEKAGVKHEILEHKTVYTAIDAAMTIKKKMDEIAKSLLVKADKDYYLVLLPADNNLNFEKLKKVIGKIKEKEIKTIKIPGEKIIENALKIKAGTITAFGKLHKVSVIIDKKMEKVKKAVFAAGTPNYSIEMAVKDFIDLEKAIVGAVGEKKKIKKQATVKSKKRRKK
ncbi:YbaK/EbsC family protein [Candidatus Parcubacteria bacterium]|nr:YbaK/EbsC family protein [Candidatus Parcubacteria bacterium]